jgi:hypothetical protein
VGGGPVEAKLEVVFVRAPREDKDGDE